MASEKMMILKMLEEGKITAAEASRLMDAAGENKSANTQRSNPQAQSDYHKAEGDYRKSEGDYRKAEGDYRKAEGAQYRNNSHSYGSKPTYSGGSHSGNSNNRGYSSQGFDDFTNELSRKFDAFAKDMEPRLQKFTETFVEKTSNFADSISKSLESSYSSSGETGRYSASREQGKSSYGTSSYGMRNFSEKNFELLVNPGHCELNISGLNGDVIINGYNGDKITAKVTFKQKFPAASIELMKLGDKYFLNYDEDNFEFVTVDAYVPEKLFKNVKIETINGKIAVSTITTDFLTINGINAKSDIKYIAAENFVVDTSNGEINLVDVSGKYGKVEGFNGSVLATGLDIESFSLSANNSAVNLNIDYFSRHRDYTWILEGSNGKFVMNVPSSPELGYFVKAKTSLNNVKLGLVGMNYAVNTPSFVEAVSYDFDKAPKKIKLSVETSNAPLVIN